MKPSILSVLVVLGLICHPALAQSQEPDAQPNPVTPPSAAGNAEASQSAEEALKRLGAQKDGIGKIGDNAEIDVPAGYIFFPAPGTRELMKDWGNLISGREDGLVMNEQAGWSVLFEFSEVGYVKDDEKDSLDADKLLKEMKEGQEAANERRKQEGLPAQYTKGFVVPPKYNEQTNNLEWAFAFTVEGSPGEFVNYNTKLLGRKGVMEVTLMVDPDKLQEALPEYQKLLTQFRFVQGETYAEYRQGDKLATYGLTGLVVGGAGYAAAKAGLFAKLAGVFAKGGKILIAGVVVVVAGIWKFVGRLLGRRESTRLE